MPDIQLARKHTLSVAHAKKIAQKAADDLAEEYDLKSRWDGDTLNFERSGVSGQMRVTASQIAIDVTLGFLLKPFKAKFESHMSHRLDELLVAASPDTGKPKAPAKVAKKSTGKRG